jgi:hypothetical protein
MLPVITRYASIAFRSLRPEAKSEAVQEVIANSFVAFRRLHELDKLDVAYPSVLARYGVAQVRDGRQVGTKLNTNDVTSPYAQQRKGFRVVRLDRHAQVEGFWRESIVEDRRTGPAETAAMRVDFSEWLDQLPERRRHIAEALGSGDSTGSVAVRFNISPGRVSQIRRELNENWLAFHGEDRDAVDVDSEASQVCLPAHAGAVNRAMVHDWRIPSDRPADHLATEQVALG